MEKTCLNPSCRRTFTAGHYGKRQRVCCGSVLIKCPRCKGAGKKEGAVCTKCRGKKQVRQTCRDWYRGYWASTRQPPREIPNPVFTKLEKACRNDPIRHALLILFRETGLRKSEALGLTAGDVFDGNGKAKAVVEVRGQWGGADYNPTKTGDSRVAYLSAKARKALEGLGAGNGKAGRLFPLSKSGVYKWFVALQRGMGITNPDTGYPYRIHDLRHSVGVELVKAKRIDLAQKVLGHKNISTTLRYAERRGEDIVSEVEAIRRKRG